MLRLSILESYTTTPGSRTIDEGDFSGEDFLRKCLKPLFEEALEHKEVLFIDLDGTEGYATSFLEEAFGGLARLYPDINILNFLEFKSEDEPLLIQEITLYIQEANNKG